MITIITVNISDWVEEYRNVVEFSLHDECFYITGDTKQFNGWHQSLNKIPVEHVKTLSVFVENK